MNGIQEVRGSSPLSSIRLKALCDNRLREAPFIGLRSTLHCMSLSSCAWAARLTESRWPFGQER
jgi:hypothetical protein